MSQDLKTWQRQTYSVLDFIGDLGGLLDGLWYACAVTIAPFSSFTLNEVILTTIFKKNKRQDEHMKHETSSSSKVQNKSEKKRNRRFLDIFKKDPNSWVRVPHRSFLKIVCLRHCHRTGRKHQLLLNQS